jgi:Xaa-Pro aminopeptidase
MSKENLLIVADSERDANMLYAVRMFVPDPFIYLKASGKRFMIMSDLEIDRARKQAPHCKVLSFAEYQDKLKKHGVKRPGTAHVIRAFLKEQRLKKITVPNNFPHGLARQLRDLRIKIRISKNGCFPEREVKTPDEIKKISAALIMAEVGLAEGIQILKRAKIGKSGRLIYNNIPLTSERLRATIDTAILQAGGVATHTIVAGGDQACNPHEEGYGPLKANVPIILDVFPRSQKTGYFGDITRTVVKGRANDAVRKMYQTVAAGQELALKHIMNGASGKTVHQRVMDFFEAQGFQSGKHNGRMQGFFHGTGHGVGLEIHEAPRISKMSNDILRSGHVITIEPGLYYPGVGGVRLEDMTAITRTSPKNLTKFEKVLEL